MPKRSDVTTRERGYDYRHVRLRKRWAPKVATGTVLCAECHQPIDPTAPWDLGHTDDRTDWTGPEHVWCNRHKGGVKGAAAIHPQHTARTWP